MAFTYRDMGCTFHEYNNYSPYFGKGWMDCRDVFHAVLCLYCCVTDRTWLSTKRTGLWVFQYLIFGARVSQAHAFSVFSVTAGWIAGILFMLFFACVTNTTKLSTKHTGLSVFQKLTLDAHISYSFLQSGIRKLNNYVFKIVNKQV